MFGIPGRKLSHSLTVTGMPAPFLTGVRARPHLLCEHEGHGFGGCLLRRGLNRHGVLHVVSDGCPVEALPQLLLLPLPVGLRGAVLRLWEQRAVPPLHFRDRLQGFPWLRNRALAQGYSIGVPGSRRKLGPPRLRFEGLVAVLGLQVRAGRGLMDFD